VVTSLKKKVSPNHAGKIGVLKDRRQGGGLRRGLQKEFNRVSDGEKNPKSKWPPKKKARRDFAHTRGEMTKGRVKEKCSAQSISLATGKGRDKKLQKIHGARLLSERLSGREEKRCLMS